MDDIAFLEEFISQSKSDNLKTSHFPSTYGVLDFKVSFGMGMPAKISWVAIYNDEIRINKGFHPVYLYYKKQGVLILAYGIMEKFVDEITWGTEITHSKKTISSFFSEALGEKPFRYGDSYVHTVYNVNQTGDSMNIQRWNEDSALSGEELKTDLDDLVNYYLKEIDPNKRIIGDSPLPTNLFYMENQLEDFVINNWKQTQFGVEYDLIYDNGELISQQYKTDVGIIDILARDKKTGSHVVIELKRNQTGDDTVGQLLRYMGWVKRHLGDEKVKGVIVAGKYDKKLEYAMEYAPVDTKLFVYNVVFELNEL